MNVLDFLWLDGRLLPSGEATVLAVDHGITVGDGVFETMQVLRGDAFALTRHLRRLRQSAEGLRLDVPYDDDALRAAVEAVIEANPTAGRIRMTVTGGPGPLGSGRGNHPATVIVAASDLVRRATETSVVIAPWKRNEHGALAGIKSTSYAENVIALEFAETRGASEAIFSNTAGRLCEGTGSNVFLGIDGLLVTPPLSSGCLRGITRELVCEVATVEERDLPLDALTAADEAFLTSSTRDIQPIVEVGGKELPSCPGPLTGAAMKALDQLMADDTDP